MKAATSASGSAPGTKRPQLAHLAAQMEELRAKGTHFRLRVLDDRQGPVCHYDGREVINLASNNYLGLCNDARLREAAIAATNKYGVGSGAVRTIAGTMKIHMELEEKTLYPAMAPVTGDEAVEEGNTEHELARKALADVVELGPDEPGFGAALDALKAGIEHHVEEEENEVFPQLRKDGTVLAEVATPIMAMRMELGLPMDADALAASSTKEELLDEARNAGIEGASSMNKDELAEALAGFMASA